MPEIMDGKMNILLVGISRQVYNDYRGFSLAIEGLKSYISEKFGEMTNVETFNDSIGNPDNVFKKISEMRPALVGFSCYLWNVDYIVEICRKIKTDLHDTRIILGGPEATGRRLSLLKESDADYLVVGEGELPLAAIVSEMLDGKIPQSSEDLPEESRAGIVFAADSDEKAEKTLSSLPALENLPTPFCDRYAGRIGLGPRMFFPYETMRGCPNRCSYCMWTELGKNSVRYFPTEKVRSDFEWIIRHCPDSYIFIADSDTFANKKRAMELAPIFHHVAEKGKIGFIFQTNLKSWDKELMLAYNSPAFEMNIGVNTLNPEVQQLFGRVYSQEFVENKLIEMREYAPRTQILVQFMYGCPKEKFSDFCQLFDWAWNIPYFYKMFFHTQVLPGTQLYKKAAELGIRCRAKAPFYTISTAECSESAIKTEELMILCVAVWMAEPGTEAYLRRIVRERYRNSFSFAFLSIWKHLPEHERIRILDFHSMLTDGSGKLLDDFQLDIMHDFSVSPDTDCSQDGPFSKRLSIYANYVSSLLGKYA